MSNHLYRVAIVGASTLKGKELKEVLETSTFPAQEVKLLDSGEAQGQLEAVNDEATFIQTVDADQLKGIDIALFASDAEFTRDHWKLAQGAGASVVDLSYALEAEAKVQVRSPWVEAELGTSAPPDLNASTVVSAHPVATALALVLARIQKLGKLDRAPVAVVLEPASERGKQGMDELHQQTVNLLSFQSLPKDVFDAQVAFNVLPRFGPAAQSALGAVQSRILSHFQAIVGKVLPVPSLMLAQAPMFHGHIFSVYIELAGSSEQDVMRALAGEHIVLAAGGQEDDPQNVSTAGQDALQISVRRDATNADSFWIWAAADNLRISALSAVECARSLASMRVKGRVN